MRTNRYKDQIFKILEAEHLVSLEVLQVQIPEADFSTLFRNIQQLLDDGVVKKVVLDSKVVVYELASHAHDHFVCDQCNKVEVVEVSTELGKRAVRDVLVRGTCEQCNT